MACFRLKPRPWVTKAASAGHIFVVCLHFLLWDSASVWGRMYQPSHHPCPGLPCLAWWTVQKSRSAYSSLIPWAGVWGDGSWAITLAFSVRPWHRKYLLLPTDCQDALRLTPLTLKPAGSQLCWIEFYNRMKVQAFGAPCFGPGILYRKGQHVGGNAQLFFFPLRVRAKEMRSNCHRRDAS